MVSVVPVVCIYNIFAREVHHRALRIFMLTIFIFGSSVM